MRKPKLNNQIATILVMGLAIISMPSHAETKDANKNDTQIELYMQHQTTTQKVQRQTELRIMDNKKALAEIDTLNIERKIEFGTLKHQRDMQNIRLEIEKQAAQLVVLKSNSKANKIIAQAKALQAQLDKDKIELDKNLADFMEQKEAFQQEQQKRTNDTENIAIQTQKLAQKNKELNKSLEQGTALNIELKGLIKKNTMLRDNLKNKLSHVGVSLEDIEVQAKKIIHQAKNIEALNAKIEILELDKATTREQLEGATKYTLIYTTGTEAMIRYGNNQRIVSKGSKVNNLTVHAVNKEGLVLRTKNGLLHRIRINDSHY
jgi:chromosome segregation ATPase